MIILKATVGPLFGVLTFILLFALAACGEKDQATADKQKSEESGKSKEEENTVGKEKQDEVKVATSMEDILQEKAGQYSGTAYNEAVVHRALDEQNFQDKDSFQVYDALLNLMGEGPNYQKYYDFLESFNGNIETKVSEAPEGMKLEGGQQVNGTANISILLDASGSMAQKIGGKTKMDHAKEAINKFVASMPDGSNVSLRGPTNKALLS